MLDIGSDDFGHWWCPPNTGLAFLITLTNSLAQAGRCYPHESCRGLKFHTCKSNEQIYRFPSEPPWPVLQTCPLFPLWSNLSFRILILDFCQFFLGFTDTFGYFLYMCVFLISNCSWKTSKLHHCIHGNWREENKIPSACRTALENNANFVVHHM